MIGVPERLEVVTSGAGVNEDLAGYSPPFYWVLDGSTPLFRRKRVEGSRSDAQWLVETIDSRLRRVLAERPDQDLKLIIRSIATSLGRDLKREHVPTDSEGPSAALALVRILGPRIEYAILGDVTVVIRADRQLTVERDERVSEFDREAVELLSRELESGVTFREARNVVRRALRDNRKYMNSQPGYWILSNQARAARHAVTGRILADNGADVLVASDGFARVIDVFHLYRGWNGLLAELREKSLQTALNDLRSAEKRDPQCRRFPRLTPTDDATALYLRTAPANGRDRSHRP